MVATTMQELTSILDIEELEHNLYRGRSPDNGWKRVFGGQVIAQALVAAQRTVEHTRLVHSLHCYFMLGGDPSIPIVYEVDRIRDGGSFTTRRVAAIQRGRAIFLAGSVVSGGGAGSGTPVSDAARRSDAGIAALPARSGQGSGRQVACPPALRLAARARHGNQADFRHALHLARRASPQQRLWFRVIGPIPTDPAIQRAILAYMFGSHAPRHVDISSRSRRLRPGSPGRFARPHDVVHRPHSLDDWILYASDSPSSSGARGLNRGLLYARDGTLIASAVQEGLIRVRTKPRE